MGKGNQAFIHRCY